MNKYLADIFSNVWDKKLRLKIHFSWFSAFFEK